MNIYHYCHPNVHDYNLGFISADQGCNNDDSRPGPSVVGTNRMLRRPTGCYQSRPVDSVVLIPNFHLVTTNVATRATVPKLLTDHPTRHPDLFNRRKQISLSMRTFLLLTLLTYV